MESPAKVNLLELASSVLASSVSASLSIRTLAFPTDEADDKKNARLKNDGTFVTDADFAAQSIITRAVQRVSDEVRILGEENPEGVARVDENQFRNESDEIVYKTCRKEMYFRYKCHRGQPSWSLESRLPLSEGSSSTPEAESQELSSLTVDEKKEILVDASRICVIIDPLDGTKSYAKGDYDAVSILISINLDDQPHFGIICKPFGYEGIPSIMESKCAAVYGGPLIGGGFIAGGGSLSQNNSSDDGSSTIKDLPRAVISSSRSQGVVEDVCRHLGSLGLIHEEPMHISGAGEKSLRLVLRQHNETLWFFPKAGTSLWDIAASDAILRSLGGKVTDKFGRPLDYGKSRSEAENVDGIIACSDEKLHGDCIRIFQERDWGE